MVIVVQFVKQQLQKNEYFYKLKLYEETNKAKDDEIFTRDFRQYNFENIKRIGGKKFHVDNASNDQWRYNLCC